MARKSLSDQVMEELDRAAGLLRSVADSVDPIIGHLLGAVQESHHRIETMCLASKQRTVDQFLGDIGREVVEIAKNDPPATTRRPRTAHKAPRSPKGS
jgi:hypothetical protein